ncbi:GNAT family N-acetyltransferase [Vibrio sp. Vb5031]|uniref:GNAT family N-acetyltransferase n=1 Tax=Vibrio TaxID=662 RepID=UPI00037D1ED1|nr:MULTISPECIES: GNAT family N-acetyltransferase [Vibrio]MDH5880178.1 GNAT family N-acetyltransferase [Vibrio sp. S/42/10]MDW1507500.1 GNAT family N-acetyltransferase [Vibrio sp. Vb5031]NOH45833.1 GNAT family N-acetyltransferase [Vibrio cyclitrophicus]OEE15968.1 ribosomal protein acetyltransferase [Vibrio cyclitrophicus ZF205]
MESERLKLEPPSLNYIDAMYGVIEECKQDLSQFLPWVSGLLSKQTLEDNTKEAMVNFASCTGEFWFNIIEKKTGLFIGVVGFIVRDKSVPYFEIGYWLQTSKTGFGYITEAVGLVEQYAFHDLLALRLEIRMAASNLKSQAVAKRCGYEAEATLINSRRLPSGEIDSTMIYAKTRC